jgi:hypothetical protein
MVTRSRQMDFRIQKVVEVLNQDPSRTLPELAHSCQIRAIWPPVIASAALALGFALGTWFANERQVAPKTTSASQAKQVLTAPDAPPQALPQRRAKHH